MNGMDPVQMTSDERMDEIAMLLSRAMLRLWHKRQGLGPQREISRNIAQDSKDSLDLSRETRTDGVIEKQKEIAA